MDPEPRRVLGRELHERLGSRVVERAHAARLRAGVPMMKDPARSKPERILRIRLLVRRLPMSRLDSGAAAWIARAIFFLGDGRACLEVVSIQRAFLRARREDAVLVEPLARRARSFVARPLDPRASRQFLVADPGVVARPAARRGAEGFEGAARVGE